MYCTIKMYELLNKSALVATFQLRLIPPNNDEHFHNMFMSVYFVLELRGVYVRTKRHQRSVGTAPSNHKPHGGGANAVHEWGETHHFSFTYSDDRDII
jgi:hypothetical protein